MPSGALFFFFFCQCTTAQKLLAYFTIRRAQQVISKNPQCRYESTFIQGSNRERARSNASAIVAQHVHLACCLACTNMNTLLELQLNELLLFCNTALITQAEFLYIKKKYMDKNGTGVSIRSLKVLTSLYYIFLSLSL